MSHREAINGRSSRARLSGIRGYSLVEILVVLALVGVMTAMSLPYFFNYARKYKTEDQAIRVMDVMREAAQLAINKRRVFRVEIDRTNISTPFLRLIDEGNAAAPVRTLKTIPLEPLNKVRMDVAPSGTALPPLNYPIAAYSSNIWAVRFTSAGTVVNAGGLPVSATLYSWRPIMETATPFNISNLNAARPEETRAVTIFGGSGAVRYWKYTGTAWDASQ